MHNLVTQQLPVLAGDAKKKKETKLGLAHSKQTSFGDWYSEVVVESEMISYYDVSGAALHANVLVTCSRSCLQ